MPACVRILEWRVESASACRIADAPAVFRFSAAAGEHAAHPHFRYEDCGRVPPRHGSTRGTESARRFLVVAHRTWPAWAPCRVYRGMPMNAVAPTGDREIGKKSCAMLCTAVTDSE